MGTISHKPAKITTEATMDTRFSFAFPRRALLGIALALAVIAATACTSARKREQPTNLLGNLRFRDSATEQRFAASYRSGSLYQDFRTVLIADAVAMDVEYRRGFVEMLRKTYLLSDADAAAAQREQITEFDGCMCLLLFLYGGNNRPIPLGDVTAEWKVLLQDDDGQFLTSLAIERLRPENPTYRYLSLYFYGLDRWSQAFKVSFPKLNKSLLGQPIGTKPVELVITGMAGTVRLSWANPGIFYRPIPVTEGALQKP
jgi:hypothetical protein